MKVTLPEPKPDAEHFKKVIMMEELPRRVHFIELHIDTEIVRFVTKNVLNGKWVEPSSAGGREEKEACLRNYIEFYYRLGYDTVRLSSGFRFSTGLFFDSSERTTGDTAAISEKERHWTQSRGLISSWEDFEKYPWPSPGEIDLWAFEFLSGNLPEGMEFWACFSQGVFEIAMNQLVGIENLSYLLYDDEELVKAVFDRAGELICESYKRIVGMNKLAGFFQGDDMGFKTSTIVSADVLRKYVLPWHKRFAELAHENGLIYLLHNCGYCESIMEDLIEDVKIDGKHSYEDEVMRVQEFQKRYGSRIAVLGGVDVDKLCRLEEAELRKYVRSILNDCMPGGGYLLGSGNSIANYVPVENFLIMLEEGTRWGEENLT